MHFSESRATSMTEQIKCEGKKSHLYSIIKEINESHYKIAHVMELTDNYFKVDIIIMSKGRSKNNK